MSALVAETPRALLVREIRELLTCQVRLALLPSAVAWTVGTRSSMVSPQDLAVRAIAPVIAAALQVPSRVFMRKAVLSVFSLTPPPPIEVLLAASTMPLCAI